MTEIDPGRQRRLAAFFFFGLVFFVYLLSYRGTLQSDDEQLFAAAAQNVAFHGSFTAGQLSGNARLAGQYNGAGVSHVILGAVWTRLLDPTPFGYVQGVLIVPPLYGALTGALLLLYVIEAGYPFRSAVLTAGIYSFASIAWVYSQGFFSETLAVLFVAAGLYFGRRAFSPDRAGGGRGSAVLFYLSLGGLVLTKAVLILIVPAILLVVVDGKTFEEIDRRRKWAILAIVLAAIAAAALLARTLIPAQIPTWYDYPRVVTATVQRIASRPQDRLFADLLAPLASPGRGLLFFSPLLLLGFLNRGDARRAFLAVVWSAAVITMIEAATVGNEGWAVAWGPRRLLPVLPLLAIAAVPIYERLAGSGKRWVSIAFSTLIVLNVGIQLGGVLVSKGLARAALIDEIGDFYSDALVWDVRYSPIGYSWKLVLNGTAPDLAIIGTSSSPGSAPEGRFLEAASFFDANVSGEDVLIVDYYLSPPWQFFFNYNGTRHVMWYSLPVPGESIRPARSLALRSAIAGLSGYESIWIVSENPEFQVGENYRYVAVLLKDYELVSIEGFSDSPAEPSIIFFHYQLLIDE